MECVFDNPYCEGNDKYPGGDHRLYHGRRIHPSEPASQEARAPMAVGRTTALRVTKHKETITCPWCNAGSTMTFQDERGEYCMACKKDLKTGRHMAK
jgi:hypothetical protein